MCFSGRRILEGEKGIERVKWSGEADHQPLMRLARLMPELRGRCGSGGRCDFGG